jgi:hypothetical protein
MPVAEIGYALGFDDPAYFSRAFRRQMGETPSACRRRLAASDLPPLARADRLPSRRPPNGVAAPRAPDRIARNRTDQKDAPMTLPRTTTALALRDGGFAKTAVPQVPETLAPHLELREVPLPDLADGQVLIEVTLAPVNPSDLFFVQGGYGQPRTAGLAAGFEGVGRVVAGKGKTAEALVGQRVSFLGTAPAPGPRMRSATPRSAFPCARICRTRTARR